MEIATLGSPLLDLALDSKLIGRTFVAREYVAPPSGTTSRGVIVDIAIENDHLLLITVEQYMHRQRVEGTPTWVPMSHVVDATFKAIDGCKLTSCSQHGMINIMAPSWDGFILPVGSAHSIE